MRITREDGETYERIARIFAQNGGSEAVYDSTVWIKVQDNDQVVFVSKGPATNFDTSYGQISIR